MAVRDFDPFVGSESGRTPPGTIERATQALAVCFEIRPEAAFAFLRRLSAVRAVPLRTMAATVLAITDRDPQALDLDPALTQLLLDPLTDGVESSVERVVFSRVVG